MPNPGQVNNGAGANGYTLPGGAESPYGAVKRLTQLARAAPIAAAPGATAPKQATRASQQPPPAATGQPQPSNLTASPSTYQAQLAAIWGQVASQPGASPLVQQIAEEAQRGL